MSAPSGVKKTALCSESSISVRKTYWPAPDEQKYCSGPASVWPMTVYSSPLRKSSSQSANSSDGKNHPSKRVSSSCRMRMISSSSSKPSPQFRPAMFNCTSICSLFSPTVNCCFSYPPRASLTWSYLPKPVPAQPINVNETISMATPFGSVRFLFIHTGPPPNDRYFTILLPHCTVLPENNRRLRRRRFPWTGPGASLPPCGQHEGDFFTQSRGEEPPDHRIEKSGRGPQGRRSNASLLKFFVHFPKIWCMISFAGNFPI